MLESYALENRIELTYKYPSLLYPETIVSYDDSQAVLCAHSLGRFQEFKKELPIARPTIKSDAELLSKYLAVAKNI